MPDELLQIAKNRTKLDANKILGEIWRDPFVQDYIIELNTEGQLREGKDSRDNFLSPDYLSDPYADAKQRQSGRKAPRGVPDLFLEGNFYESFDIKVLPDGFLIIANTTIYGRDFLNDYGFDILGLSNENLEKLIAFIEPIWTEKVWSVLTEGINF